MRKIAISAIAAAMGFASVSAYADAPNGGLLTINGELTAQTCDVSGEGQGNNFTVTLPTLSAAAFQSAGKSGGSTGFKIALTNCMPDTGNVRTFWEYGVNTLADGNLKNNGTATNIEVQLVDFNGGATVMDVSKSDGSQNSKTVAIASGTASLQYAAQYYTPAGGATPGSVTTNVTYSMSYQ
ncbi:fimbrial protein [Caballeronia calidae]|uniref:Fimbrial protein n=1 Tax=Caballeronia calidae TaxID=1777139 RepID=A0A158E5J0_9BURK|nr:fimbrial protein [Caballeronia calidae]SAL01187.1 fimbrial protein [Caballeronia calidae]